MKTLTKTAIALTVIILSSCNIYFQYPPSKFTSSNEIQTTTGDYCISVKTKSYSKTFKTYNNEQFVKGKAVVELTVSIKDGDKTVKKKQNIPIFENIDCFKIDKLEYSFRDNKKGMAVYLKYKILENNSVSIKNDTCFIDL